MALERAALEQKAEEKAVEEKTVDKTVDKAKEVEQPATAKEGPQVAEKQSPPAVQPQPVGAQLWRQ